jgi:hypothetical protein
MDGMPSDAFDGDPFAGMDFSLPVFDANTDLQSATDSELSALSTPSDYNHHGT